MSQQKGRKLWKKIGKKDSNNSSKFSSESSSVQLIASQIDTSHKNSQKRQNGQIIVKEEIISPQSLGVKNDNSLDFFNKIRTLGVQIQQVQVISEVEHQTKYQNIQSNCMFAKLAKKYDSQFLRKQSQDFNNSLEDSYYSPMQAIGSPFISSHSNKYSSGKSVQVQHLLQILTKFLFQTNEDRQKIKREVLNAIQFFKNMRKIYDEYITKRLQRKSGLNHSIIDENSLQDISQNQQKQNCSMLSDRNQKIVFQLKKQLQTKINLIQQLENLIETNKNQYLTFKQMYQKTNQQLNEQLDQMDRKLSQANDKCDKYQRIKQNLENQLLQIKTNVKNIQQIQEIQEREQLQNSASFKIVQISPTKTIGRIFTFGQGQDNKQVQTQSPENSQKKEQTFLQVQSTQKQQKSNKQINNTNINKLLELKQNKLKQYQKTIQQLLGQINDLSIKSSSFQKQLFNKSSELQKIKNQVQKSSVQISQYKQQIQHLSQQNKKYLQYTQNLQQSVFDFQQKAEQIQQECDTKLVFLKQQIIEEQTRSKTLQQNYVNLLQKMSQKSNCNKHQQNQQRLQLSIDSPKKNNSIVEKILIKNQKKLILQLEHQLETYKSMYQDKQKQIKKLQNKLHKLEQKNIDLIQEQLQRETDKFRLQSFRQQSKLKQNILKNYKCQKEQLLDMLNNQRQQLIQKTNKIDQLQLKLQKITDQLKQLKHNKNINNEINEILVNAKSKKQSLNCDCLQKQKILLKKQEELHHLQMHLQSQKRMLQLTKRQIETQYQTLLIKFNELKSNQLQQINFKSIQHLSSPLQTFFKSNVGSDKNNNFRTSLASSPRTFNYYPQQISQEASRIIQRLKSQGSIRGCSVQRNSSKNKIIYNQLPQRENYYNNDLLCFNNNNKRQSINHQINFVSRQEAKYSPLKDKIKERGQSRKLKMKIIEEKMKKLKDQVKNSLS